MPVKWGRKLTETARFDRSPHRQNGEQFSVVMEYIRFVVSVSVGLDGVSRANTDEPILMMF